MQYVLYLILTFELNPFSKYHLFCFHFFFQVYEKTDPQPSLHLIRLGEKTNEITKRKFSSLLRDVKTIDYASKSNDQQQTSTLTIDFTTNDREYSFLATTFEEKKEFFIKIRKVC